MDILHALFVPVQVSMINILTNRIAYVNEHEISRSSSSHPLNSNACNMICSREKLVILIRGARLVYCSVSLGS